MGWANCGTDGNGRPIGYAHQGTCDHPGCEVKIDRGLDYACGGMHGTADGGCELYFCHEHLDQKRHQCSQGGVVAMGNKDLIEKALELDAAATPGPWLIEREEDPYDDGDPPSLTHPNYVGPFRAPEHAADGQLPKDETVATVEADYAFAAESRTLLPALATALEQADKDLAAAGDAIVRVRGEANQQRARAEAGERELSDIRAAWESERSQGGKEPEAALTCMLQALYLLRELERAMANATLTLIGQRDEARAELARIKGTGLPPEIVLIAYRHAETERCGSTAMQSHEDRATLLDAVRVLTADRDSIGAMIKIWTDGDEPEGQLSALHVLNNIAQMLGVK